MRQRAKNLQTQSTDTERHLWYHLRANRLGFKFKRQVPIGNYIVDFLCNEGDGTCHWYWEKLFRVDLDAIRNAWPPIAAYLKDHKNFYDVYEDFIKLPSPMLEQQTELTDLQEQAQIVDGPRQSPMLNQFGLFSSFEKSTSNLSEPRHEPESAVSSNS